jgi:hypothetical protein
MVALRECAQPHSGELARIDWPPRRARRSSLRLRLFHVQCLGMEFSLSYVEIIEFGRAAGTRALLYQHVESF